ncbi:ABC transporter substrate-binding protein [Lysinimonas soli]|uniref:ABC transporter substrate-binding protein n=1 Tax=Lysinimonas soli TaxID=1074233 RepID=A0ABW0NPI6_9MICO
MKRQYRGIIAGIAVAAAAALALTGCANSGTLSGGGSTTSKTSVVVGSANFPENVTLAYVYGEALAADGVTVSYKVNIGARAAYFSALQKGEIDLVPEYAGSILSYLDKTANAKSGADVKTALDAALPKTLTALEFSEAADSDSLNVTADYAKTNNLTSIADLAKVSGKVILAANPEFETRPDGLPGLKSVYGLSNITFQAINDGGGPATAKALQDNTVQVADIYSTTPSIVDDKFVTLTDPKNLFASQQVVPIVTASKASKISALLDKVSAKLTTKDLLAFNKRTGGDEKADPKTVALDWLKANGFTK